ncbi:hypothetical protein P4193_00810 [Pseudomonas aeruginosa]|nr:hypothetical protein [Pseudomonas aeruginosa]MDF5940397.1 hypothetical protein [Pseudomonas aeruginosa]MDF5950200.1 hypothetical protein [Pseudomonas aeruginosa]
MVLITSLAIEEAAETLTEDGGRFGDTLFGGQVIEAARALLKQQTEDQGPPLPWVSSSNAGRIWAKDACG